MSETDQVVIRSARLPDVPALLRVINAYAAEGVMLPRTEFELAENIRDFVMASVGGQVAGCGALHFYTPRSAEIRSLAVSPVFKSAGIGRQIVETLEVEARAHDLHSLFAFTYVPGFFVKLGFHQVDRGELPLKAWKDCLRCPKFQACDEIAMLKQLNELQSESDVPTFRIIDSPTSATLPTLRGGMLL